MVRNNDLSGDISSWVLPSSLINFQIYSNDFTGDISVWDLSNAATPVLRFFQIHNNDLTGDLSASGWANMTASMDSFIISGNDLSGDLSGWVLPDYANGFNLAENNFT